MKIRLSFKTPDVVDCAIEESVECHSREDAEKEVREACKKWVEYGECLTVDIDTETGTCEVVPV